jgi:hypothetical protein
MPGRLVPHLGRRGTVVAEQEHPDGIGEAFGRPHTPRPANGLGIRHLFSGAKLVEGAPLLIGQPHAGEAMPDERPLTPAATDDLEQALAHALRFDGRKQFKVSGESMARISAAHLVEYLRQSGFVVMRKPPTPPHSDTDGRRAKETRLSHDITSRKRIAAD